MKEEHRKASSTARNIKNQNITINVSEQQEKI
jgi:hypothetical protein